MRLTIKDVRSSVEAFKQVNTEANKTKEIYAEQAQSVCEMLLDDIQATETKEPVSRRRYKPRTITRPAFCAPERYDVPAGRRVETLWPCALHKVECSFITSVGYFKEEKVLKIVMTSGYVYAYQDVPEAIFVSLLNTSSVGKLYNKVKRNYASVALV